MPSEVDYFEIPILFTKRNKKPPKRSTPEAINNPVYTLPYGVKLPVSDLASLDGHPAWNSSTVNDKGSIYNAPTAPYAVIQKPRTGSNPDELDVVENCVYANSRDSSLSTMTTAIETQRSEDTAQQFYNEEAPTALNRQATGSESRGPGTASSNKDTERTECKDIEVMENELYQQNMD